MFMILQSDRSSTITVGFTAPNSYHHIHCRAKSKRSSYLEEVSSTELFLATLMVASKYLYDDGEVDEVFNDDWAEAGRLDSVAEMNRLEIEFLCAVEWSLHVQVHYKV